MKKLSHQRMRQYVGTISGVLVSAIALAQPLTGSYTINQNLVTAGTNYQSFNDAVSALQTNGVSGPVTFEVSADTYNEQVVITPITGASAINRITFHGNEASAITYNPTNSQERAIVKLNGADYIVLSDLSITATGNTIADYGYGVQLMNDADYNVIEHCVINTSLVNDFTIATNYAGIMISATDMGLVVNGSGLMTGLGSTLCDNNVIRNNTIRGGYFSIAIGGNGASSVVTANEISGNALTDFFRTGIYLNGNMNTQIFSNDIHRPNRPPNTAYQFFGFWIDGYSSGLQVSANKLHDPFGNNPIATSTCHPIYVQNCNADAGNENVFTNNILYNMNSNGTLSAFDLTGSSRFRFVHNTISLDDPNSTSFSSTKGIATSNSSYITFTHNILKLTRGSSSFSTKHAFYLVGAGTNNVFNHNDVFGTSNSGTLYFGRSGSTDYANLTAWQTGSGFDLNSMNVDPQFTNAAMGNLLPQNTSLQVSTPANGVTTDILGLGRSATSPTLGAFEINGTVLPVQLSPLTGKLTTKGTAVLSWKTLSETNNYGFIIERSDDGKIWTNTGFVPTKAFSGNSSAVLSYNFQDDEVLTSTGYYRLQQVDMDGSATYSNVVVLQAPSNSIAFTVNLYPNPADSKLQLQLEAGTATSSDVVVLDQTGRVVLRQQVNGAMAFLDISQLVSGLYIIRVNNGANTTSARFTKSR